MTVRDLIALLRQEHPDTPVVRAVMHDGKVESYQEWRGFDIAEGARREQPLSREPYWRVVDHWTRVNDASSCQDILVI